MVDENRTVPREESRSVWPRVCAMGLGGDWAARLAGRRERGCKSKEDSGI